MTYCYVIMGFLSAAVKNNPFQVYRIFVVAGSIFSKFLSDTYTRLIKELNEIK
jgi:hypothetical protein